MIPYIHTNIELSGFDFGYMHLLLGHIAQASNPTGQLHALN